jgi:2-hydroxychromene-2-carboxylate isomerase
MQLIRRGAVRGCRTVAAVLPPTNVSLELPTTRRCSSAVIAPSPKDGQAIHHVDFFFDFISPFAYLQFKAGLPRIRTVLAETEQGHVAIRHRPILFAGLLGHWGNLGRLAVYQAQAAGFPIRLPPAHPFNPLRILRLAVALEAAADPNFVSGEPTRKIFEYLWRDGGDVHTDAGFFELSQEQFGLSPSDVTELISDDGVKRMLRENTEEAIRRGAYGVPSLCVVTEGDGDELFWGNDSTGLAIEHIRNPNFLQEGEMDRAARIPQAIQRKR